MHDSLHSNLSCSIEIIVLKITKHGFVTIFECTHFRSSVCPSEVSLQSPRACICPRDQVCVVSPHWFEAIRTRSSHNVVVTYSLGSLYPELHSHQWIHQAVECPMFVADGSGSTLLRRLVQRLFDPSCPCNSFARCLAAGEQASDDSHPDGSI
jgi:hypothetical protein